MLSVHVRVGFTSRLDAVRIGLLDADLEGRLESMTPRNATRGELTRVHTPAHLDAVADPARRRRVIRGLDFDTAIEMHGAHAEAVVAKGLDGERLQVLVENVDARVRIRAPNPHRFARRGLDPMTPGRALGEPVLRELWAENVALMRTGLRLGRIVTTDPSDRPGIGEEQAWPEHAHLVYRRRGLPCRRCGTPVAAGELEGRTLYWCPSCQR